MHNRKKYYGIVDDARAYCAACIWSLIHVCNCEKVPNVTVKWLAFFMFENPCLNLGP
jgi:hypothetical protein